MDKSKHNENIKDQFSKQAIAYTAIEAHANALDILIQMSGVSKDDNVIDVACGSGIVSCEFAKFANHVTGIDITENMLKQARELQAKNELSNIDWILDDVVPLRFDNEQFSIVVSRFSFHHFIDYERVFDEMIRVCKPKGNIMVVDVALPNEKLIAYDTMEKLRDSSHVGALSLDKFEQLFQNKKLTNCRKTNYNMVIDLETQLKASFLNPEDKENLRSMIINDAGVNNLGIGVSKVDGGYQLQYPICVYVGQKM